MSSEISEKDLFIINEGIIAGVRSDKLPMSFSLGSEGKRRLLYKLSNKKNTSTKRREIVAYLAGYYAAMLDSGKKYND